MSFLILHLGEIGLVAAMLAALQNIPQVWKTYQTKNVYSLSLMFILIQGLSAILFIIYGWGIIQSGKPGYPIIISNGTCVITSFILSLQYCCYYKKNIRVNNNTSDRSDISPLVLPYQLNRGHTYYGSIFATENKI